MAKRHPLRIVLSGGGTGGHVYPAIAIADALKELPYEVEILFVGANGKVEMKKGARGGLFNRRPSRAGNSAKWFVG